MLKKTKKNGKQIGSTFERDIAKYLTVWVTGQEKPYVFWRSPGSGGLATLNVLNKEISGDIIAIKSQGEFFTNVFSIECKKGYGSADFWKFLSDVNNDIEKFWTQCCTAAIKTNKLPMLIFKRSNTKNVIIGLSYNDVIEYLPKLLGIPNIIVSKNSSIFFNRDTLFKLLTIDDVKQLELKLDESKQRS